MPFVDDVASVSKTPVESICGININTTDITVVSPQKLLDTGQQQSDNCCNEYRALMQNTETEEPDLLGFVPVQRSGVDNQPMTKRKPQKKKRSAVKYYSNQIYKRVLKDVLRYFNSRQRKSRAQGINRRRKTKSQVLRAERQSKKKKSSGKQGGICEETSTASSDVNFCYDVPPNSVDSGYSAQMSTESECSEVLSCKLSDCDIKSKELELFGSESESDCEVSQQKSCGITESEKENFATKRRRINSGLNNRRLSLKNSKLVIRNKENKVLTRPDCTETQKTSSAQIETIPERPQTVISEPSSKSANERLVTPRLVSLQNEIEENVAKRVFKRPNCRKRAIESPRSPEPTEDEPQSLHRETVIIPLNKPKRLSAVVISNLFKKLLTYPEEPQIADEVTAKLSNQEPTLISQ